MLNDCLNCHKEPYETDSTHWHYCNDCVKICTICRETKPTFMFGFDFKSAEYKRWHEAKAMGFMNPTGYLDECFTCLRAVAELLVPAKTSKTSEQAIQLMLDTLLKRPTATESPDSTLVVE